MRWIRDSAPTSARRSSKKRWRDAVNGIHPLEQKAHIEKGKIAEYRATIEVTFVLED